MRKYAHLFKTLVNDGVMTLEGQVVDDIGNGGWHCPFFLFHFFIFIYIFGCFMALFIVQMKSDRKLGERDGEVTCSKGPQVILEPRAATRKTWAPYMGHTLYQPSSCGSPAQASSRK